MENKVEISLQCAVELMTETDRSIDIQQCFSRTGDDPALDGARKAVEELEKAIRKCREVNLKGFAL